MNFLGVSFIAGIIGISYHMTGFAGVGDRDRNVKADRGHDAYPASVAGTGRAPPCSPSIVLLDLPPWVGNRLSNYCARCLCYNECWDCRDISHSDWPCSGFDVRSGRSFLQEIAVEVREVAVLLALQHDCSFFVAP